MVIIILKPKSLWLLTRPPDKMWPTVVVHEKLDKGDWGICALS